MTLLKNLKAAKSTPQDVTNLNNSVQIEPNASKYSIPIQYLIPIQKLDKSMTEGKP